MVVKSWACSYGDERGWLDATIPLPLIAGKRSCEPETARAGLSHSNLCGHLKKEI